MTDILSDLKVVELATVLAGPLVGSFLGEHGADVTKIEPPGGDVTRNWKHPEEGGCSYFAACNWRKKSIELNLEEQDDKAKLLEMLKSADIVISNFLPRVAEKLKLTTEDVKQINSKIIQVKLLGYASDPTRPAYDAVMQAETGWMGLNGSRESGPMKIPVAIVDLFAAHHMKQAVLLALIKRGITGQGSLISCDLESSSLSNLANQASLVLAGVESQLNGSRHPNIAPYGEILRFSNGDLVMLAVGADTQFESLCKILECEYVIEDKRFASNSMRVLNRGELMVQLQQKARLMSASDFLQKSHELNVPAGRVNSLSNVLNQRHVKQLVVEDSWGSRITTSPFTID